jgi:hypothetical protein
MRPADHPDFFRMPPPPGRSRESRIVLDENGRFWNDGVPIDHEAMAVAFASWIRVHPDDHRPILTNGYDWTYFMVKDVPFFIRHVESVAGRAVLRLFDGTEEALDPATVEVADDGVLYAKVKEGTLDARFLPTAQAEMVEHVTEGPDGEPCVEAMGRLFPIRQRARLARPAGSSSGSAPGVPVGL